MKLTQFNEDEDDEKLRTALSGEDGRDDNNKDEDLNTVAAKSLLGPRILSLKKAAARENT